MYQKEIVYIGLYKEGNRMGSAGFMKVENREQTGRLYLKVQNIPLGISGKFPVRVYDGKSWRELNGVTIQDGKGEWENCLSDTVEKTIVQVMLPGGYALEGKGKTAADGMAYDPSVTKEPPEEPVHKPEEIKQEEKSSHEPEKERQSRELSHEPSPVIVTEELPGVSAANIDVMPQKTSNCNLKEDKWEQILDTYEKIHPYGDGRVYVKLEPRDFVILQEKYQHLVNNSFLLHGFYNYRYVILGKEGEYYLGVPGVFYEREKMVALMFGFEAFECPGGNVRQGEFGYYLRKVEL